MPTLLSTARFLGGLGMTVRGEGRSFAALGMTVRGEGRSFAALRMTYHFVIPSGARNLAFFTY